MREWDESDWLLIIRPIDEKCDICDCRLYQEFSVAVKDGPEKDGTIFCPNRCSKDQK